MAHDRVNLDRLNPSKDGALVAAKSPGNVSDRYAYRFGQYVVTSEAVDPHEAFVSDGKARTGANNDYGVWSVFAHGACGQIPQ